jgi:hypothetical protein
MRVFFIYFIILVFGIVNISKAQTVSDSLNWKDYWLVQGQAYIHLSQGAQFNWAKGGDNIFSSLSKFKANIQYKKDKQLWDNTLSWNYGFLFVGVPESKTIEYRTNDDYFEFNSSYGYVATGKFYYNGQFNFKTQFWPGYKYPNDSVKVSNFLSPAYIIFSIGMQYKHSEMLNITLSPLTSKTTLVVKEGEVDETKFGLKNGERIYKEVGAYMTVKYIVKLMTNIRMENQLTLFSNYQYHPENIDFDMKNDFNFQINKNVKAVISLQWLYDDDALIPVNKEVNGRYQQVGYTKGLQFQEKVMIGFGLTF